MSMAARNPNENKRNEIDMPNPALFSLFLRIVSKALRNCEEEERKFFWNLIIVIRKFYSNHTTG